MRRYNGIVESESAPSKFDLWMFRGSLKYFGPNGWTSIKAASNLVSWEDINDKPEFATVATSGSYNDLSDKPTIPPAYTLPLSASTIRGGIKIGFTQVDKKYPVQLQNEQAFVEVPWTDTKYTLPAATKTVLGGIKAGTDIAALAEDAELATVIETVNSILTQLKTAGVLI